jgi:hypothetical protein
MDVCEIVDDEPITYYEAKEFEELIPNTDLALLLNSKGEIVVGDKMYRITKAGTYFFAPSLRAQVNLMIEELDQMAGTNIDERTVELADGIMRYNTFQQNEESDIIEEPDMFISDPQWGGETSYGASSRGVNTNGAATRASTLPPTYPLYYVDAHTVIGEFLEGIFGRNKSYEVKLSENRRLKGKLYYYDYLFYSEMGATGKFQKDQWIGWSNTEADMMAIVWADLMVELQIPTPNPSIPAPSYASPTYLGTYTGSIPGSGISGRVLVLGGIDPLNSTLKTAIMNGRTDIEQYLMRIFGPSIMAEAFQAILFVHGRKVYSLTAGASKVEYNVEKMTQVFNSSFGFEIKAPSDVGDALAWFQGISGTSSGLTMQSAKCMIEAQDGVNKKGVILVKRFD